MLTEEDLAVAEAKAVAWLKGWEGKGAEGEESDAEVEGSDAEESRDAARFPDTAAPLG